MKTNNMEDKIKELLMQGYYKTGWNKNFIIQCINDIKSRIVTMHDSFSIVLFLKSEWTIDPDYDLLKGIEEIKQDYFKQSNNVRN